MLTTIWLETCVHVAHRLRSAVCVQYTPTIERNDDIDDDDDDDVVIVVDGDSGGGGGVVVAVRCSIWYHRQ